MTAAPEDGQGGPPPRQGGWWRRLVAFDRLGNTVIGGKDTETISSHAARTCRKQDQCAVCWRAACVLCWLLGLIDPDHCTKSEGV